MKKEEVPQEKSVLESANMTDLYYVTDDEGNFTTAQSTGWDAKAKALDESMELIRERMEAARKAVAEGTASPIVYFMELNKMDFGILASYTGIWTFFVKQHARAAKFKKLKNKTLQKYADAFGISKEELINFDGK
ncbi:hypothetical protein [Chryseobacterium sp. MFBS3-17]|uniref:hypothetical protein n=1 Tax=Chryseobacterium sp. MFBS3-17 TaxID=2886689 RepID=UPI001D0E7B31|nr:hypothetical protein [Chryseobacterium sp. MFBS3-17]MCC2591328.1 hypothetical protein [Chryseobacterium sp. MFBS3-17]